MYTPKDLEEIAIAYLVPGLTGKIAGEIVRSDERNTGSDEDVTVSTLSITDGHVQRAIINLTIYCKDVQSVGADVVNWKPNTERFDDITRLIVDTMSGNYGKYWKYGNMWITSPSSPKYANKETSEHFLTIRLEAKVHLMENVYNVFFGASENAPLSESDVNSLTKSVGIEEMVLMTGTQFDNFSVIIPAEYIIYSVKDIDADDLNITSEYVKSSQNITIGSVLYSIWTMKTAVPYSENHKHRVLYGKTN